MKAHEREKIKKKIVPMCSYPTRNRKFQKNRKKFESIIIASFQVKIGSERPRRREN